MLAPTRPPDRSIDDPEQRAARRVVEAAEEFYAAGRAYGLSVDETRALHAPWPMRVDAYLYRVGRERAAWARTLAAPLFRAESRDTAWVDNLDAIRDWVTA